MFYNDTNNLPEKMPEELKNTIKDAKKQNSGSVSTRAKAIGKTKIAKRILSKKNFWGPVS